MPVLEQSLCTMWATIADVCAPCNVYDLDPALLEEKLLVASEVLYNLTFRQWPGVCTDTVRPCAAYGGRGGGDFPWWSGQTLTRTGGGGNAWGFCGCHRDTSCGCYSISSLALPRWPVVSVASVKIDGDVLDPAFYRVDDHRRLTYLPGDSGEGWPCFVAGTLVTTMRGPVPIESVRVGDTVLTHRGRWRKVTRAGKTGDRETAVVRGHGSILRCTADHLLWAAPVAQIGNRKKLGAAEWMRADGMVGSAWSTPSDIESTVVPLPDGWETVPDGFWWFVGRWIGDGWVTGVRPNGSRARVRLCAGHHEADDVEAALPILARSWGRHDGRTAVRWGLSDAPLASWLSEHFGEGAAAKQLPGWLLGAPEDIRRGVLDGLMSADGWRKTGSTDQATATWSIHTVSRPLAMSVRMLAATLGYAPSYFEGRAAGTGMIEGRSVATQATYRADWAETPAGGPYSQAWTADGSLWARAKSVTLSPLVVPVYDIEVEDDHSFIANGIAVHNCCQRLDRPSTEDGTFEVSYRYGKHPPLAGVHAAAALGCQLVLAVTNSSACTLPKRVQSITRQGVTATLIDNLAGVQDGWTGLFDVDLFIASVRKARKDRGGAVYDPQRSAGFRRPGV